MELSIGAVVSFIAALIAGIWGYGKYRESKGRDEAAYESEKDELENKKKELENQKEKSEQEIQQEKEDAKEDIEGKSDDDLTSDSNERFN